MHRWAVVKLWKVLMDVEEAKAIVDYIFMPDTVRRGIVGSLESAYAISMARASDYGPWTAGQWTMRQNRKGVVEGELDRLARTMPDARSVVVSNRRGSHAFVGIQIGQVLILPARTATPISLPRKADVRCRLAHYPQKSFLEDFTQGFDDNQGEPLLVILAHGPARGTQAELGWARVLLPDHTFGHISHAVDLTRMAREEAEAITTPVAPVATPLRRRPAVARNTDTGS